MFSATQIAHVINGTVIGEDHKVNTFAKIEEAPSNALTFLANLKYEPYIYTTEAGIIIVDEAFEPKTPISNTLIKVKNAYEAFAKLLQWYEAFTQPKKVGIDANVQIDPSSTLEEECYVGAFTFIGKGVKLGKGVKIYPNCFIDDHVTIGDNTILYAGVRIYKDCHIGSDCVFHSGVVIGADGFGFAPSDSSYLKIPQIGNVIIKDRVELGANTTIDRATMGSTLLEEGVKLDNLVQVAHNVTIGKNTVIAAQTGIAGSTKIGAYCMIGGQVAIIGHITIGDGVKIGAKSAVNKSIPNEMVVQGIPALPIREFQVNTILATRKLKQLFEDVEVLKGKQN